MADANVILRIGSALGPGGLSSLKAGWDMLSGLVKTIVEVTDKFDKMKLAMERVDMGMVNYADDASKGQIATDSLVRQLNMLNQSAPKLKVTQEQFGIMSARAAEFAEATGQDATAVFERMTNGIARAESEALKPFGIKLKENIDISKTQKQAVDALTKGFEDFEYTLKSNGQRLNQLSNNWGTFTQALYNAVGDMPLVGDALDAINESLGETVKALTESTAATRAWAFEWTNFSAIVAATLSTITVGTAYYSKTLLGLINKGLGDDELKKKIEEEIKAREASQYGVPAAPPKTGGGAAGETGSETTGISFYDIGLSPADFYSMLPGEYARTPEQMAAIQGRQFGKGRYGGPPVLGGRDFSGASSSVDQMMAEAEAEQKIVDAKERRLKLVTDEFEIMRQIKEINDEEMIQMQESSVQRRARIELVTSEAYEEERLKELREEEHIYRAERQIELQFEREQALDFAQQFGDTWSVAMDRISAGAMAADGTLQIMRGTWAAIVTSAIEGHNGIGEAIRETIKAVGIQIAIEAGLMALLSAGRAAYYYATRQYVSATKAAAAAIEFAATAAVAGVAAATASAFGKSAKSIRPISIPTSVSSGGSATPSYGGSYSGAQPMQQEIVIRLAPDAGSQMFEVVQQQNDMAYRAGYKSFQKAS